jgi:hypothetical protein
MKEQAISSRLGRRQFIKRASLVIGASTFILPYSLRAKGGGGLRGAVRSGPTVSGLPLSGVGVRLYELSGGTVRLAASGVTSPAGTFSLQVKGGGTSSGIFYATADLAPGLQLVSVIGPSLPEFVTLNELTTVAAGYSMAQFTDDGALSGDEFGLRIAAGMNRNLVDPATGESSAVLLSSPNADQTNSLRSTRALANLLALFVRNGGTDLDTLFKVATPPGGVPPTNLLQALANIARFPQQNVTELFSLTQVRQVYSPALLRQPDAWTIVVKVNDTGSDQMPFGGPGNLAFDADGYAWITNNVVQGTGDSGRFNVVLKPDGRPADGSQSTPRSPLVGGGVLGAGFGVNIAPNGKVWFGNFGWGFRPGDDPSPHLNGSVSEFDKNGRPVSGPLGYQGGVDRAQGIAADADGNIWICSFGNDRIVVFPKGDPSRSIIFQQPAGSAPFDIQIASDGTAVVSNSGGFAPGSQSSIARFALVNGQIQQLYYKLLGHGNKALALDSRDQVWVASGTDSCVYLLDLEGNLLGQFNQGGIESPWSTAVDGDDNIWVANFGPQTLGNNFTDSRITKLAGSNPATRPPGLDTGDPISPSTGYTLPSAGQQVLLHNGDPLYGAGAPPSFSPLMRITGVVLDQAGNVWALNNWKPDIDIDAVNPGGDGICIFVGLAKPPRR